MPAPVTTTTFRALNRPLAISWRASWDSGATCTVGMVGAGVGVTAAVKRVAIAGGERATTPRRGFHTASADRQRYSRSRDGLQRARMSRHCAVERLRQREGVGGSELQVVRSSSGVSVEAGSGS